MESNQLAKKIFCDLVELDQQGFNTWATDASKLVNDLRLDVTNDKKSFSMNCKRAIQNKFKTTWITHLQNTELYPRLRTYRTIKYEYIMEPYLYLVKKKGTISSSYREISLQLPYTGDRKRSTYQPQNTCRWSKM